MLDTIEGKYEDDHVRMVKVFGEWFKYCKAPSFLKLIKAVINIGKTDIAEGICKQKGTSLDTVKAFIESQPDSQSESESEEEEQGSASEIPVEESPCTSETNSQTVHVTIQSDSTVAPSSYSQSELVVPQSTPLPPECVLEYAEYLKCKYKTMHELPNPNWPPCVKVPVKLAVIDRGDSTQPASSTEGDENHFGDDSDMNDFYIQESMQYDYLHGKIDNSVDYKKEIELPDVFKPKSNKFPWKVLMDGAPGVGKTTQTRKACIDWANGKILQQFHLVILVPLREASYKKVDCLEKLIPDDNPELRDKVMKYIQETCGKHILLIFDGYDELSAKERNKDSFYFNVIKGSILSLTQCNVLVTSRPYASHSLQRLESINQHVEVLGFTEKQIERCIMKNMTESKARELIRKLQERLDVASLCYVPLNCAIVMYVYKANRYSLPSTLTELYSKFILFCLKREAISVKSDEEMEKELFSLQESELPDGIRRQLSALSMMAYNGLCQDKQVFSYKDLKTSFSNCTDLMSNGCGIESCCLGLVTSMLSFTGSGEERYYQFLHLSIQEFLAARYIANCKSSEQQLSFFCEHLQDVRYHLVLLFLAGITQLNVPSPETLFLKENEGCPYVQQNEGFLHICHVIFESKKHSELYPKLFQCLTNKEEFRIEWRLTLFDCMVLAHFLCLTNHFWKKINLSRCLLTSRSVEILSDVFCGCKQSIMKCEELDLRFNLASVANSIFCIPWLLQVKQILCTDLLNNQNSTTEQLPLALEPERVFAQLSVCTMPQTLEILEIEQCSLLVKCITPTLSSNNKLTKLHLWKINATEVLSICQALEQNSTLKELGISWCTSDFEDSTIGHTISRLLKLSISLEILKINDGSSNDLTNDAHVFSWRGSVSIPKLDNVLSDEELADILSAANSSSCRLKSLFLCDTELVCTYPECTWDLIPKYYDYCYIRNHDNRCSDVGHDYNPCKVMFPQLFCAINLFKSAMCIPMMVQTEIDLHCSDITSSRVIGIFTCMESNTTVQLLDLSFNSKIPVDDSQGVAIAVGRMLERNSVLKKLGLAGKSVNDIITISIASALSKNGTLKELNLDGNSLSDFSIIEIISSVISSKALSCVCICGVALTLPPSRIVWRVQQILNLHRGNMMKQFFCVLHSTSIPINFDSGCLKLNYAQISRDTALSILLSVHQIVNLKELDLSCNKQMGEGDCSGLSDAFKSLLVSSKVLQVLDVEGCSLNDTVAEGIAEGLRKSMSLEKLNVKNNPLSERAIVDILSAAHESAKCRHLTICNHVKLYIQYQFWSLVSSSESDRYVTFCAPTFTTFTSSLREKCADIVTVLKATRMSLMPVKLKSFQVKVSGRTPIIDTLLPPLEQISQTLSAQSQSIPCVLHEFEVFTSLKLESAHMVSISSNNVMEIVRGSLSCKCVFKWEPKKELRWQATITFELNSVTSFTTSKVEFQVYNMVDFSIQEATQALNLCTSAEVMILNKLIKLQSDTQLHQQYKHPVSCEDIIVNVLRESSTLSMVHFTSCSISVQSISSNLKENNVVKYFVLDQVEITAVGVASIIQSFEYNTCVQQLTIKLRVEHPEEESELVHIAVEKMLMKNSSLKMLSINVNSVILNGVAAGIANNSTLQTLELYYYNESLQSDDIVTMAAVLSSAGASNLCEVILTWYNIKLFRLHSQCVWNVERFGEYCPNPFHISKLSCAIAQSTMNVQALHLNLFEVASNCTVQTLNPSLSELHLLAYSQPEEDATQTDIDTTFIGKAIKRMLETSTTLKKLDLDVVNFSSSLSKQIATGVSKSTSLNILSLSSANNEILQSVKGNTNVEKLSITLRHSDEHESISEVLSHAIDSLFGANSKIKVFQLKTYHPITIHSHPFNSQSLQKCVLGYLCEHSVVLDVFNTLQQNIYLEDLTISWFDADDDTTIGLACGEMLKRNKTLKVLDFRDAMIKENTANCIAAGLKENSSLETLNLGVHIMRSDYALLSDDAIAAIHSAANLSNVTTLTYSSIHDHVLMFFRLQSQDNKWILAKRSDLLLPLKLIAVLGQSLMHITNASCEILDVNYHGPITTKRMSNILKSLQQMNFDELAIFVTYPPIPALKDDPLAIEAMGKAVECLLVKNTAVKLLKLFNCNHDEHDLAHVATGLSTESLRLLDLSNSGITVTGAVNILQALHSNTSLEVLDLSNNPQLGCSADGSTSESIGLAFEAMLKVNTALRELYVNKIGTPNVITHIFEGLCTNHSLLKLDITGTVPNGEYIAALADMLAHNHTLTDLCITLPSDWYLHFDHIAIVRALLSNTSLKAMEIQPHHPNHTWFSDHNNIMKIKDFLEEEMEGLRRLVRPDSDVNRIEISKY